MSLSIQALRAGHLGSASPQQRLEIERYSRGYLVESDDLYMDGARGHTCRSTEHYFQRTLLDYRHHRDGRQEKTSKLHGACAVYAGDDPVGLVKHHKSELLLAVSTVKDSSDTYKVIRGGVYMTDFEFELDDDKPSWSYTKDGIGVRTARRLDEKRFVSEYEPSTIDDTLREAERVMSVMRENAVEL